jgi:chromosomal replication initiation ATPase DnaA
MKLDDLQKLVDQDARFFHLYRTYRNEYGKNSGISFSQDAHAREWQDLDAERDSRLEQVFHLVPVVSNTDEKYLQEVSAALEELKAIRG